MSSEIRLAIVGWRKFCDTKLFNETVTAWIHEHGTPGLIVSGGATGADTLARDFAHANGIPLHEFCVTPEEWKTLGKRAGPMRNRKIVDRCTHMIAFPNNAEGKGTQITMDMADRDGIPVHFVPIG